MLENKTEIPQLLETAVMPSLQSVLALDNAWCLKDVMKKLIEASEILLHQKNYDGHGWEEINHCVERGKEIVSILSGNEA
jgi:hypothetical protein